MIMQMFRTAVRWNKYPKRQQASSCSPQAATRHYDGLRKGHLFSTEALQASGLMHDCQTVHLCSSIMVLQFILSVIQ